MEKKRVPHIFALQFEALNAIQGAHCGRLLKWKAKIAFNGFPQCAP